MCFRRRGWRLSRYVFCAFLFDLFVGSGYWTFGREKMGKGGMNCRREDDLNEWKIQEYLTKSCHLGQGQTLSSSRLLPQIIPA